MFIPAEYTEKYIENYRKKIKEYALKGEEELKFKSFGAITGVYQERSGETYMVRPRTPAGMIETAQLKAVSKIASKYGKRQIRFTTRQDIQFHTVALEDTIKVIEELKKVNVYTVGTGGDSARNVACSPLSGLDKEEAFDVTPYALASTNYIVKDENSVKLPRKLKLAFSSSKDDTGNTAFADLGFIAEQEEGKEKFRVFIGGGYGGGSRLAIELKEKIDPKDTLYYAEAVKEFFFKEGDRQNRGKARLRHLVKKYGEEDFLRRFYDYLEEAKKRGLDLDTEAMKFEEKENSKTSGKEIDFQSSKVLETKFPGIYGVYVHPRKGKLATSDLNKIIRYIESLSYEISIRLTPTQGFILRGIRGEEVEKLLEIIDPFTSEYPMDNSLVCVGADTCRTGIGSSQKLFQRILNKFRNADHSIKTQLPKLYISGCPSSCGQHLRGEIGFSGKMKKIDGEMESVYVLYTGGAVGENRKLAEKRGEITAQELPSFLYQLAELKRNTGIKRFSDFLDSKEQEIQELIEKYAVC